MLELLSEPQSYKIQGCLKTLYHKEKDKNSDLDALYLCNINQVILYEV